MKRDYQTREIVPSENRAIKDKDGYTWLAEGPQRVQCGVRYDPPKEISRAPGSRDARHK